MPMRRRDVLKLAMLCSVSGASLLLAGCEKESAQKPRPIKLGRDVCEHCTMLVSDPAYAALMWNPQLKRYHVFDDIGCAVVFAAESNLPDSPDARLWVANAARAEEWLDARAAYFRTDGRSPMGYNYAAEQEQDAARIRYAAMREQAIERGLCRPPGAERKQRGS